MLFFIIFVIVVLNALCIFLMYKLLKDIEKKEKFIFIAVGVAIIYGITALVHWIGIQGLDEVYQDGIAKDLVTFLFVPINGLIVLPALASSYNSYKQNKLSASILGKRTMVLLIPLLIVLVLECVFIKNIQVATSNLYYDNTTFKYKEYIQDTNMINDTNSTNITEENTLSNDLTNEVTNNTSNEITDKNEVNANEIENEINENEIKDNKVSNTTKKNNTVNK